eukprot:gnl/TRDRNA2_/TRDRNA2_167017_c0_seq1.p2 gnl/TRDRNA2_/TRDRNA2_167017_c0~~gnl/TRDRNA2_/TRDRNA2_167017_c0_seq1.p2  ORF type:complete len:301 (+),score=36.92 gnl/TRDRNA2_/TRDRNA2_167017_c0_seq1:63-965(+)
MGQVESDSINDQPPPGGTVLYIQEEGDMCIYPVPAFDHEKPPCIPNTIPDHQWKSFKEKVSGACSQMWTERPLSIGYVCMIPLFFIFGLLPWFLAGTGTEDNEHDGEYYDQNPARRLRGEEEGGSFAFLGFLPFVGMGFGLTGLKYLQTEANNKKDEEIRKACAELQSAGGGQITVEYRTRYTGVCKPKGAQPTRFVVLGPAMAPVGMMPYAPGQMGMGPGMATGPMGMAAPMAAPMAGASTLVTVMVPEGVNPGATLRIQVPGGQDADVVVPEGLVAGQSFQAQVPAQAPPVIQATVVG